MKNPIERLRLYAESIPITFESWIISFLGIVLVRTFLEQFSSFLPERFPIIDLPTIVHYSVTYLAITVSLMVILMFFAKTNIKEVSVICLLGSFVIFIAPLIDLATGGIGGHIMSYIFAPGKELLVRFITFFGGYTHAGITLGIKVETVLGIIFCFGYVYTVTKNIGRSISAAVVFYCLLFFLASMPSVIALFLAQQNGPTNSLIQSIISSQIIQNNLHPSFSATSMGLIDLAFNKIMLGVNALVAMLATMLLFFLGAKKKFIAMAKNSRPERIFYFFLLITFGAAFAHAVWSTNWIDIESYVLALVAFVCAAMFSICQNDMHDEAIDNISNPSRPLVTKELSRNDMKLASNIFLLFAFLTAYASGHYVLFFTILFLFIYFIYSNPPLRLKRFVIVNSSLVSLACAGTVLEGFFLVSSNKSIIAFPFGLILGIIIFHTIVSNIRDIKDFEGDKANGIKTVPVLLGLKKSKQLIAGSICFFYLLIPWYFHISFLIIPSIIATVLSWYFITKENYKEWKGFAVYMMYLILIIGAIILK